MPSTPVSDWRQEFGIGDRPAPAFLARKEDIAAGGQAAPQPHALRRAFAELQLDGVLCLENSPAIYFRQVERIKSAEVAELHRRFWNQGVAPILVLIAPDQVHIYSGLTAPTDARSANAPDHGLVERLNRVSEQLRAFILAVESGEYFHTHRRSFDPRQRVDRDLLRNLWATREELKKVSAARLAPQVLDGLLCRLVFTCYLFDRKVIDREYLEDIGIRDAEHLRDILGRKPRFDAKVELYKLFAQLGPDFNGDLFSEDLEAEAGQIRADHLDILNDFFRGTNPRSGQQSFWPYDFGIIPIETISAIYEHFLKAAGEKEKKEAGAFYTPRFLAELVLDRALDGVPSLLGKRFLDPSCGSGIFLVGLFNRLAEEWNRQNPKAGYDAKLRGLTQVLKTSLFGIDKNRTACLIAAFSLNLALLDQLSPPDIRRVLRKVKVLPRLVGDEGDKEATVRCADFFTGEADLPQKVQFVVGNPPWGSTATGATPAGRWCAAHEKHLPDKQLATAFIWKAPEHLEADGKVCFVLPHGTLFKHSSTALEFQKEWIQRHAVDFVLNLADYQRFLFEEAESPALVVRYSKESSADRGHRIDYWVPKADWRVTQADLITVPSQDRSHVTVREVLDSLKEEESPQIWKELMWSTPRDRRLLDRLGLMQRLRSHVRQQRETNSAKPWLIAEGCQPIGPSDDQSRGVDLALPSRWFLPARSKGINLILTEDDCAELPSEVIRVRSRSNKVVEVFKAPHVLVSEGFSKVAFASFPVSFHDKIRGIYGPERDRELLLFLAAYLRSPLARYFQFHTSSSWGVGMQVVDMADLLRTPFPWPEHCHDTERCRAIVCEVAGIVSNALMRSAAPFTDRKGIIQEAQAKVNPLIDEYFDLDDTERMVIADTVEVIIPSVRPTRARLDVPTIQPSNNAQRATYTKLLCDTLNGWASKDHQVHAKATTDESLGVGLVVLENTRRGQPATKLTGLTTDVLSVLHRLQRGAARSYGTLDLVRGLKVFEKTLLYITKPLGQRFWTRTAALNDADEIAGTILMHSSREAP